jgi:TROVE domain
MSKFSGAKTLKPSRGRGPITAANTAANAVPDTLTHGGAPAYTRDLRSDLFLLGVANMVAEDTFYEPGRVRDSRFTQLVRTAAVEDFDWLARYVGWLRNDANMRSASLVAAAEAVHARLAAGLHGGNRQLIASALARADEPGEMLAYWWARFGKALPKPVKRGVADAALALYSEYPLAKYDTASHGVRWADLIELCRPGDRKGSAQGRRWKGDWQRDLFRYAIERRHDREDPIPESLTMLRANLDLRLEAFGNGNPECLLDVARLKAAGMTWEDVLSLAGARLPKARLWEALIPVMGMMALARNLRNFDEAGISRAASQLVIDRFCDPAQVARSRMLPFRWLAAYEASPSHRYSDALDQALQASLANIPTFGGRTLVLVDTSSSMTQRTLSAKSKITPLMAGAVFGVALAAKGEQVDLHGFASDTFVHKVPAGASLLRETNRLVSRMGEAGHGTEIAASLRSTFLKHDRVVLISDMQTMDAGVSSVVPDTVPLYGFNLGGYGPAAFDAGRPHRVELGGLTDHTFTMIPMIEQGKNANWPF